MVNGGVNAGGVAALGVLASPTADRDFPQSAAFCPVPAAVFAVVARLREVVVVVVAELRVR